MSIRDVVASGALVASSITGVPEHPVERIALRNIRVAAAGGGAAELASMSVPDLERRYPDATMFADLPAYGLYCRHVAGLTVEGLALALGQTDARSAVVLESVRDARLRALRRRRPAVDHSSGCARCAMPAGRLRCRRGGLPVAQLSGATTDGVHVARNDRAQMVAVDREVQATALQIDDAPLARDRARRGSSLPVQRETQDARVAARSSATR